ncbi:hypothetical protein AAZV13_11G204700 [Glycine max]
METVVFINISTTSLFLFTLKGLKLKPTHFPSHINKYSTPSTEREREREGSEPIPSSEEGEVLVIPLQLEEASKGIALIPNPSFNILLSFPLKILILFGIMLSLWISPLVASIMMALMDFAC